jgi:hypothetical protein
MEFADRSRFFGFGDRVRFAHNFFWQGKHPSA